MTASASLFAPPAARRWCPHTPFAKQRAFLDLTCTEALYGGSAGSAKSDALLMAALQYVDVPGYAAILFRRTFSDLNLPGAIMDRSHEWLAGTAARWNGKDRVWTFPSGAKLAFGYLENARDHLRYQGATFQFVGFDEQGQFEKKHVLYLASRLRRLKGSNIPPRLRGATNPGDIGHRWIKERYAIPDRPGTDVIWSEDEKGNPIAFVPARLDDNPYVDREAYLDMLAKLDSVTRDQLERGWWIFDASGKVYKFDRQRNLVDALPVLPRGETWTKVLAGDFGVTDPTALVVLAFTRHDPCAYVVEAEEWPGLAPSDAGDIIRAWQLRHGIERSVGDFGGLGKGFEAEFGKRHVPMHAAEKADKLGNIKLLNGELERGRLKIVAATCEKLVEEVEALQWKDERHQKEHPAMPNHATDAMLYGWRECRNWLWEERPVMPASPVLAAAQAWEQRIAASNARIASAEREGDGFAPADAWRGERDGFWMH